MPEKPATRDDRSAVSPKDDRAQVPQPATSSDRDAKARDTDTPEDEKRIERFRER
jgi:hypothetical protein